MRSYDVLGTGLMKELFSTSTGRTSEKIEPKYRLTIFSMTVITDGVSLCTLFKHWAIRDIDSSFVAFPTVEPGLFGYESSKYAVVDSKRKDKD